MVGARRGEQQGFGGGPPALPGGSSNSARIASPPGVPPGSRVSTTSMPRARSASPSSRAWVDLPAPSPPSKATNRPHVIRTAPRCRCTTGAADWPAGPPRRRPAARRAAADRAPSTWRKATCCPSAIGASTGPRYRIDSETSALLPGGMLANTVPPVRSLTLLAAPFCTSASPTSAWAGSTTRLSNASKPQRSRSREVWLRIAGVGAPAMTMTSRRPPRSAEPRKL